MEHLNSKDKARQLVDTYTRKLPTPTNCEIINYPLLHQGKLIAKMAAAEVEKACKQLNYSGLYWKTVQDEIDKIENL